MCMGDMRICLCIAYALQQLVGNDMLGWKYGQGTWGQQQQCNKLNGQLCTLLSSLDQTKKKKKKKTKKKKNTPKKKNITQEVPTFHKTNKSKTHQHIEIHCYSYYFYCLFQQQQLPKQSNLLQFINNTIIENNQNTQILILFIFQNKIYKASNRKLSLSNHKNCNSLAQTKTYNIKDYSSSQNLEQKLIQTGSLKFRIEKNFYLKVLLFIVFPSNHSGQQFEFKFN
eukprot:TRINITY_DN7130_c0_g1_i12.p4 TRINITY_DN7130_c0_g1~~TRINITY_DN7130_c0_g1_i12.p4  ORF type:complete len:226 (-),score=-1.70 TRINITY_DN7130_c0_g1_i12:292-969(-)